MFKWLWTIFSLGAADSCLTEYILNLSTQVTKIYFFLKQRKRKSAFLTVVFWNPWLYIYDTKLVAQLKFALILACLVMFNENKRQGSTFQRYDVMFTLPVSLHQPKNMKYYRSIVYFHQGIYVSCSWWPEFVLTHHGFHFVTVFNSICLVSSISGCVFLPQFNYTRSDFSVRLVFN